MTDTPEPRVWIGCLAAYNAGTLYGEWVDVPDDPDELWGAINRVLKGSPEPGAEEWFFADNEGFHPWNPGENPDIKKLCMVAEGIREHGSAFAAWWDHSDEEDVDSYSELEESFREVYRGAWDSTEDFARNDVEELGLPGVGYLYPEQGYGKDRPQWSEVLDSIDNMLDWGYIASMIDQDYSTIEIDGKTHYFYSAG